MIDSNTILANLKEELKKLYMLQTEDFGFHPVITHSKINTCKKNIRFYEELIWRSKQLEGYIFRGDKSYLCLAHTEKFLFFVEAGHEDVITVNMSEWHPIAKGTYLTNGKCYTTDYVYFDKENIPLLDRQYFDEYRKKVENIVKAEKELSVLLDKVTEDDDIATAMDKYEEIDSVKDFEQDYVDTYLDMMFDQLSAFSHVPRKNSTAIH